MTAYLFVLIPLLFYIPMFGYETYIAFRRIGKPIDKGGEYLHATWEATHTFLILSVNYFMWLFSSAIVEVAQATIVSLLVFGAAFIVRGILYLYLFYIKVPRRLNLFADWAFAASHIVMLICINYALYKILEIMLEHKYAPTDTYLPLLLPGLILMIPLVAVPLYFLYRTKSK